MKIIGIILIVGGIAMLLLKGISFTREKNVVDLGPLEINRKEKKDINFPVYAGVAVIAAGLFFTLAGGRKK
ncbi:hypothetical protein ACFSQD_17825 [Flavihumibacter stibioxidans]|uniref:DUF3185 domain-containing protein n=1 Tax=Flavihumibacter stibioxidans TaxID=1834163 RepID=A0ABR7MCF1_9BACT|nr:hypothetical protein [Flavihumibacter stibioxidans]MBC6492717.1 hypothetical protein [Flavihumibacter stibioxidans]